MNDGVPMKACGRCKREFPVSSYWIRRRRGREEPQSYCQSCFRIIKALWSHTKEGKAVRDRHNRSENHKISVKKYMSKPENYAKSLERRKQYGRTAMGRLVDARCKAKRRMTTAKTERGREKAKEVYMLASQEIDRIKRTRSGTFDENARANKLTEENIREIRHSGRPVRYLAERYDVSKTMIRMILKCELWKDVI